MSVIAAVDDSDRASRVLTEAKRLADAFDVTPVAIHVLERSDLVSILETEIEGDDVTQNPDVQQAAERVVTEAGGPDMDVVVRVGDPADEITGYAETRDIEYVVVGGRQRSPTGKALFGSVTQRVMFQSPAPVVNVALDR